MQPEHFILNAFTVLEESVGVQGAACIGHIVLKKVCDPAAKNTLLLICKVQ